MPTASPSLVKSLLQERRRWKFQTKRGNREIGRKKNHNKSRVTVMYRPIKKLANEEHVGRQSPKTDTERGGVCDIKQKGALQGKAKTGRKFSSGDF